MANSKLQARFRRKTRIRQRVAGTSERPRLTVFRSLRHMSVQLIDDQNNQVIAAASSVGKSAAGEMAGKSKIEQAKLLGAMVAQRAKEKGVSTVVFDRNGYRYHGRVLALADAAREAGLTF